jgi:flagellar protein FlaJ
MDEKKLLLICSAIFLILLFLAYLSGDFAIGTNLVFIGMIIMMVPYSIYRFLEFRRLKRCEEGFPAFLRDVAESQRAGLSIIDAIKLASKNDYGILSNEIKKMSAKLSWNIQLEKVLKDFSNRMKKSKVIIRSIMIMEESNKSGGNIEDTMDSLAGNIEMIRDVQDEKGMLMRQQVMMIYAIFFIFLGISIALVKLLIPMLQVQTPGTLNVMQGFSSNPCSVCTDGGGSCAICDVFFGVSSTFGFGGREDPSAYYKALFFTMVVIQGFFSGLVSGQIGSDSVVAGLRHSMIMLLIGIFAFILVTKIGVI